MTKPKGFGRKKRINYSHYFDTFISGLCSDRDFSPLTSRIQGEVLDNNAVLGRDYTEATTDTTQQSGQTPDK